MLYHIKLKKAMSYTGIVNATREESNVYTRDKDIATAAVRSGYFDLIEVEEDEAKDDSVPLIAAGEEAEDSSIPAHFDKDYLDSLSITDLKKLAGDLGVAVTKGMKKDDLVAAITAETVTVPAADDAQPDFGED